MSDAEETIQISLHKSLKILFLRHYPLVFFESRTSQRLKDAIREAVSRLVIRQKFYGDNDGCHRSDDLR